MEDDLFLVTQTLKEKDRELGELKAFKRTREVREAVGKHLAEEMANFRDESGKQIKVLDRFIPEDKLYADIDISNEVLIRERVKSVLKDGLQAQEAIRRDLGYQGTPLHTVPEAQGGVGGGQNVVAQLQKTFKEAGPVAALSEFYKMSQG
jgi:restriction endonuclease